MVHRKSDVSGSVTSVSGDKLSKIPTANAEMALQGMAPGLSVNFGSGAAGSSATLQVRGVTSWKDDDGENSESNGPLVIIDGVPGNMSYLNPEDIKIDFRIERCCYCRYLWFTFGSWCYFD